MTRPGTAETHSKWSINPELTVAASAVATVGASLLVGHGEMPEFRTDPTERVIVGETTTTNSPWVYTPGASQKIQYGEKALSVSVPGTYARTFDADPAVGRPQNPAHWETVQADVTKAVADIQGRGGIAVVTVHGKASAEATLKGKDAGIYTHDVENDRAALARAKAAAPALEGAQADKIIVTGKEADITPLETRQLEMLYAHYGFDSLQAMTTAYNNGEAIPVALRNQLDALLGADRGVEISVDGTFSKVMQTAGTCIRTVVTTEEQATQHNPGKAFPYLVPVVLPIPRRRRQPGDASPDTTAAEQVQPTKSETQQQGVPAPEASAAVPASAAVAEDAPGATSETVARQSAAGAGRTLVSPAERAANFARSRRTQSRIVGGLLVATAGLATLAWWSHDSLGEPVLPGLECKTAFEWGLDACPPDVAQPQAPAATPQEVCPPTALQQEIVTKRVVRDGLIVKNNSVTHIVFPK